MKSVFVGICMAYTALRGVAWLIAAVPSGWLVAGFLACVATLGLWIGFCGRRSDHDDLPPGTL